MLLQVLGASGHAKPEDLITWAKHVNAQKTVTWHSFKPEKKANALRGIDLNVYLPTKGKRYHIKNWKNRLITLKWP